jgi:hypothetical protein
MMSGPNGQCCGDCAYWEGTEGPRETDGRCHRHAPSVPLNHPDLSTAWPLTEPDDWCGEWKAVQA